MFVTIASYSSLTSKICQLLYFNEIELRANFEAVQAMGIPPCHHWKISLSKVACTAASLHGWVISIKGFRLGVLSSSLPPPTTDIF